MYNKQFHKWFAENFNGYSPHTFIQGMTLNNRIYLMVAHRCIEMAYQYFTGMRTDYIIQNYESMKNLTDNDFFY